MDSRDYGNSESSTAFWPPHESSFAEDSLEIKPIPITSSFGNVQEIQQRDDLPPRYNDEVVLRIARQKESIFTLYTRQSPDFGSWERHYHSPHNPLEGILYAESDYMNQSVDEINLQYAQQREWITYPLTKDELGNFKVPKTCCAKCYKEMDVVFLFTFSGDSRMRDADKNEELVCPLIEGDVMYLAHLSCLGSIILCKSTVFKILERKISFREWWTQTDPWKDVLKALIQLIFMLLFVANILFFNFAPESTYKSENITSDVGTQMMYQTVTDQNIFVVFISIVGGVAILIIFIAFGAAYMYTERVVMEFFTACRGNYRQLSLKIWEPLSRTNRNDS